MQDRLPPDQRTSCNARPDHTLGSQPAVEDPEAHVRSAPDQRTSAAFPASSPWGQSTKSLRFSPLRGGKSREAGSDGEDSDSGAATINSRIVGVIKNSKIICGRRPSHTANRIYQPTTQ